MLRGRAAAIAGALKRPGKFTTPSATARTFINSV
jgi:hypothetical protein